MEGFKNWEFMTTHCWSEKAAGDWILEICDTPSQLRNFKTPGKTLNIFLGCLNSEKCLLFSTFYLQLEHLSDFSVKPWMERALF